MYSTISVEKTSKDIFLVEGLFEGNGNPFIVDPSKRNYLALKGLKEDTEVELLSEEEIIYKIKTTDGKEVVLTNNHPVLTDKGWLTIEDGLVKGMSVAHLPKFDNISDTNSITIDEAKLLGYLLTDGYLTDKTNQTIKATFNNYLYIDEISGILKNKFGYSGTIKKRSECDAFDIWLTDGNHGTKSTAKLWLKSLNLLEEKHKLKNSVQLISKMPEESLKFFINRAFTFSVILAPLRCT